MISKTLLLEALGPISIRTGRNAAGSQTLRFIPGNSLRGALAAAHQLLRPTSTDEFAEFFLSDAIQFGNAYPSEAPEKDEGVPARPLPLTARSCKRYPGFDKTSGEQHGIVDALIPSLLFTITDQNAVDVLAPIDACSSTISGSQLCGEPLQSIRGFFRNSDTGSGYSLVTPQVQLTAHIGINRSRGTVQDGVLYQHEAIVRGTVFESTWRGDGSTLERVIFFAEEAADMGLLRVGTSRTRGFGELGLKASREDTDTIESLISSRLEKFMKRLHDYAIRFEISLPDGLYVPITLNSDVIVRDNFGRYLGTPPPDYWEDIGFPPGTKVVWSAAESRRIMGWDALLGLPKDDQWGLAMGSVLVLFVPGALVDVLPLLTSLEKYGLGDRRNEGFGRVLVADEFHLEVAVA